MGAPIGPSVGDQLAAQWQDELVSQMGGLPGADWSPENEGQTFSSMVDMIPLIGGIKMWWELGTGFDTVTGQHIDSSDWTQVAMIGLNILPVALEAAPEEALVEGEPVNIPFGFNQVEAPIGAEGTADAFQYAELKAQYAALENPAIDTIGELEDWSGVDYEARNAAADAEWETQNGSATTTADDLAAAADRAGQTMGPGSGPAYGTKFHSEFETEVNALGNANLSTEVSYLNGLVVLRGTAGSVRLDVVEGPLDAPTAVYDLKTGSATLSPARIQQIQAHVPGGNNVPVLLVRP
jgi:hypothetical protein